MQNNLDQYFRDKLLYREFVPEAAHWEAAEALLEADEKRKRRRFLLWWTAGLACLLAVVASLFFWQDQRSPVAPSAPISQNYNPIAASSVPLDPQNPGSIAAPSTPGNGPVPLPEADTRPTAPFPKKNMAKSVVENTLALPLKDHFLKQPEKENQQNTAATATAPETVLPTPAQPERQPVPQAIPFGGIAPLSNLAEAPNVQEHPDKKKHFTFGVAVAQLWQPGHLASADNSTAGLYTGLTLQYGFAHRWFASAGVGYLRRSGDFGPSQVAEVKQYSFGLERSENQLVPSSLHYLSLPVSVGWKKGRHVLEGGLSLDFLTGVRGAVAVDQRADFEPGAGSLLPGRTTWISHKGFSPVTVSPILGYRFLATERMSFGLAAQLDAMPIANGSNPSLGQGQSWNERLHLRLQAIYFLQK